MTFEDSQILKLLKDTDHLGFLNTFDEETSFSPDISKRLTCGRWLIGDVMTTCRTITIYEPPINILKSISGLWQIRTRSEIFKGVSNEYLSRPKISPLNDFSWNDTLSKRKENNEYLLQFMSWICPLNPLISSPSLVTHLHLIE